MFFSVFFALLHCPVQSIRIKTFSDIWEGSMRRSTRSEFQFPSDKNPEFQLQMVHLISTKEPPSTAQKMHEDPHTRRVVRPCVRSTHCDNVITSEPHRMKKNIMKLIKRTNYLPLFLYSNISFMLSQYEKSGPSLIGFKHWHNAFDYVMLPITVKYLSLRLFFLAQ